MKRLVFALLAPALLVAFPHASSAYENANGVGYVALQLPDTVSVTIDGQGDDWAWFHPDYVVLPREMSYNVGSRQPGGDIDISVRAAWTPEPDNRIYVFVQVVDDTLNIDEVDMNNGWQDDDLEIIIDADHGEWHEPPDALRTGHQQWTFHIPTDGGYPQVAFLRWNQPPEMQWAIDEGLVEAAVHVVPAAEHLATNVVVGYEISMPTWDYYSPDGAEASTPHIFELGQTIGMAISLNEADSGNRSHRLSTNSWEGGAHDSDWTSEFTMEAAPPAPPLSVVSPNGGESWIRGNPYNIWWIAQPPVEVVVIEYSPDNGETWTSIAEAEPNDGLFGWSVPEVTTSQALVRISDANNGEVVDQSNGTFHIRFEGPPPTLSRWVPDPAGHPDSRIMVRFNQPLDGGTIDGSRFSVVGSVTGFHPSGSYYDGSNSTLVFFPDVPFQVGETVTVTLSGDIAGVDGQTLDGNWNGDSDGGPADDFIWQFLVRRPQQLVAYPAGTAPVLDGRLDPGEYAEAVPVYVEFTLPGEEPGLVPSSTPAPRNAEDMSFLAYALYTDTDLYVAVDVTDDIVMEDSGEGQTHHDDDVEVYFDGDRVANDVTIDWGNGRNPEGFKVMMDIGGDTESHGLYNFGEDWFGAADTSGHGYVIEFGIPLASIDTRDGEGEAAPAAGDTIGFNLSVSDDDDGGGLYDWPEDGFGALAGSMNPDGWHWSRETDWGRMYFSPDAAPALTVLSPNGGRWLWGAEHVIRWQADAGMDFVRIEYSVDGGTTWSDIAPAVPNTGTYGWLIPVPFGSGDDLVQIRISDAADGDPSDTNDWLLSVDQPVGPDLYVEVWRPQAFPGEPVDLRCHVSGGEWAGIGSAVATILRDTTPVAVLPLLDDGGDPDVQAGDKVLSARWAGTDALGEYLVRIRIEDVDGLHVQEQTDWGIQIAHTILSIPNQVMVSPEGLGTVRVPVLIESDGTGFATARQFVSLQLTVHTWENGFSVEGPVVDTVGAALGGRDALFDQSVSWNGDEQRWESFAAYASADSTQLITEPGPGQTVLAYVIMPTSIGDTDFGSAHIGINVADALFDEVEGLGVAIGQGHVALGRGDLDRNGAIDAFDAWLVLLHQVRRLNLDWADDPLNDPIEGEYGFQVPQFASYMADVSGHMHITAYDATLILFRDVGLIDYFPTEEGYYRLWDPPEGWWNSPTPVAKPATPPPPLLARTLSLGELATDADGLVSVPVLIDDMAGVLAGTFELAFDPTHLQPVGLEATDLTENSLFADNAGDRSVRVSFAGADWESGSGALVKVLFQPRAAGLMQFGQLELVDGQLNEGNVRTEVIRSALSVGRPQTFALYASYPNPFNPHTTVRFQLPAGGDARLLVYNLAGQRVRTLARGWLSAGLHQYVWNGKDDSGKEVSSGVYLCRLESAHGMRTQKMALVK